MIFSHRKNQSYKDMAIELPPSPYKRRIENDTTVNAKIVKLFFFFSISFWFVAEFFFHAIATIDLFESGEK
jgi:hypothetical protein